MNKYKAIIFDMDGTLFDTEQISRLAWLDYKDKTGLPISEEFIIELIGRSAQSAQIIFEKYMPKSFNQEDSRKHHREYMQKYKEEHGPLPKTNLNQLFTTLKDKGYRLALCSSSSRHAIDLNLSFDHLHSYFDVIVDGSMVSNGKPSPDIYLLTANLLNLDSRDCLVVEDSKNGILAGHAAKMDVVMMVDMVKPDEEMKKCCIHIYNQLEDLYKIL